MEFNTYNITKDKSHITYLSLAGITGTTLRYGCNRVGLLDIPINYTLLKIEETKLESYSVAIRDEIEK